MVEEGVMWLPNLEPSETRKRNEKGEHGHHGGQDRRSLSFTHYCVSREVSKTRIEDCKSGFIIASRLHGKRHRQEPDVSVSYLFPTPVARVPRGFRLGLVSLWLVKNVTKGTAKVGISVDV